MNLRYPRWLTMLSLLALAPRAFAADSLDEVDKTAREWVKLRVETARLESTWTSERELLASTVSALQERAALVEEKRDLAKAKTARDREDITNLRAKSLTAADDLKSYETRLNALTEKLRALRPQLPPRLSDALEMSFRSLANPTLPVSERWQLAMNVLNRCTQFNRLVTVGEDILSLEGEGGAKSFETLYWGLSHGYAVDRNTRKAWLGSPSNGTWRWEPRAESFDQVIELLAVARDKSDPALIVVPAPALKSAAVTASH